MKNSQTITNGKKHDIEKIRRNCKSSRKKYHNLRGTWVEKIDCTLDELLKMSDEILEANKTTKYFWIMDSVQNRLFKLLNMII